MPVKLSTTITKISSIRNSTNQGLVKGFHEFMKSNGCSDKHINNNLKAIMNFDSSLDARTSFLEIQGRGQILKFLDSKIKNGEEDPDRKWITTWSHLKYFFRWLYNIHNKSNNSSHNETIDNISYPFSYEDWETPGFIQIKKKKTKRSSPYLETELWDRDELLCII